jgi:uncharacterized protein (TIGR01244 family)
VIDARQLARDYAVAPQIEPADCAAAAAMGFRHLVNNRPDGEVPETLQDAAMAEAAAAAGLGYLALPVGHGGFDPHGIERLAHLLDTADGPILAWCRSGTRSAMLWALARARGGSPPAGLVAAARHVGYDLGLLVPVLDRLAREACHGDGSDPEARQGPPDR